MIVVAILSILALIALPKFADIIEKSREASTMGHLGHIRSAILLYYMENDQVHPAVFAGLIQPTKKYIDHTAVPLHTGDHPDAYQVDDLPDIDPVGDSGNWSYVTTGDNWGYFYIQCVHRDMKGELWSAH